MESFDARLKVFLLKKELLDLAVEYLFTFRLDSFKPNLCTGLVL